MAKSKEIKQVSCLCGKIIPYNDCACSQECYLKISQPATPYIAPKFPTDVLMSPEKLDLLWSWLTLAQREILQTLLK